MRAVLRLALRAVAENRSVLVLTCYKSLQLRLSSMLARESSLLRIGTLRQANGLKASVAVLLLWRRHDSETSQRGQLPELGTLRVPHHRRVLSRPPGKGTLTLPLRSPHTSLYPPKRPLWKEPREPPNPGVQPQGYNPEPLDFNEPLVRIVPTYSLDPYLERAHSSSIPRVGSKTPQISSNRDQKALNKGTLVEVLVLALDRF